MSRSISASEVKTIILACEAGLGSSLMSVNALKKKLKKAKVDGVTVVHKPVRAVPTDAQVIIVHKGLAKVARSKAPEAVVVTFSQFLNDPAFDRVVTAFTDNGEIVDTAG
ncbi:MAG: PTS lactose transporter subunit IIB [Anaerolineae bacterium]